MKIYAPVKDFDGLRNNVRFVRGVGETDDYKLVEWFVKHGYTVESQPTDESRRVEMLPTAPERESEMLENGDQPDFESMNPNELRDWAKANGFGGVIKNTRNKEKLIEILRG